MIKFENLIFLMYHSDLDRFLWLKSRILLKHRKSCKIFWVVLGHRPIIHRTCLWDPKSIVWTCETQHLSLTTYFRRLSIKYINPTGYAMNEVLGHQTDGALKILKKLIHYRFVGGWTEIGCITQNILFNCTNFLD